MIASETVAERRRKVLVGELPNDFLRLIVPSGQAQQQSGEGIPEQQLGYPYNQNQQMPIYSFVPPNTRGRLSVTILEASLVKNYGLVRMDPYCRLRVGHAVFETQTKMSGGRTPFWNRIVHAYLPNNVESIYVQIFDEKAFSADECIAWAHVMLPEGIFNGETIDEFFPLSGQQGEGKEGMVHLVLSFAALSDPMSADHAAHVSQVQPPAVTDVVVSEEEIKGIKEMFPDIDDDIIRCILEEKRGDKDAAVSAILELTK